MKENVALSGVTLSRILDKRGRSRESGRVGKIRDDREQCERRPYMERRVHIYQQRIVQRRRNSYILIFTHADRAISLPTSFREDARIDYDRHKIDLALF